jgi:ferredoxin-type protein NapH
MDNRNLWQKQQWLLLRRFTQLGILALFLLGPLAGVWFIKGNLSASLTLDLVPLTDPFILIQSWLAGQQFGTQAILGAVIVAAFYLLVGGRTFCAWVCPVNMVTDFANWLRNRLGLKGHTRLAAHTRYWLLAACFVLPAVTGFIAWELINPVSVLHRGLLFGMGSGWLIILAVFLFDLAVSRRGWCGHLCPMGAFYSLLGSHSPLRVRAVNRDSCDKCMDCFQVCPEPQVIRPALFGKQRGIGTLIDEPNCTNCGRCIDVCSKQVFIFGTRFGNQEIYRQEHLSIQSDYKPEQFAHEEART